MLAQIFICTLLAEQKLMPFRQDTDKNPRQSWELSSLFTTHYWLLYYLTSLTSCNFFNF